MSTSALALCGLCVVQIGSVASGSAKPRLDSLEVYGKPRAEVAASAAAESRPPAAAQISTETMLVAAATSMPSLISPTPSDWTGMEYLLSQALLTAQSLWDALQGGQLPLQRCMLHLADGADHLCLQMYVCAHIVTCLASFHHQTRPRQQRLLSCKATSLSATWWHPGSILSPLVVLTGTSALELEGASPVAADLAELGPAAARQVLLQCAEETAPEWQPNSALKCAAWTLLANFGPGGVPTPFLRHGRPNQSMHIQQAV